MTKREKFLEYAKEIKNHGYTVFVNDVSERHSFGNYGFIINDKDQVGYFQLDDFGTGCVFSTIHKPAKGIGTGFGLDDHFNGHTEITKELVDRVFVTAPDWYRNQFGEDDPIRKWSAKEFLEERSKSKVSSELILI